MEKHEAIEEAARLLRQELVELRSAAPSGQLSDRLIDVVGDTCTIIGVLLLFVFPADPLSVTLSAVGFGTLGYNHLIRKRRAADRERVRQQNIDMLELRVEQLERLLSSGEGRQ